MATTSNTDSLRSSAVEDYGESADYGKVLKQVSGSDASLFISGNYSDTVSLLVFLSDYTNPDGRCRVEWRLSKLASGRSQPAFRADC